MKKPIIALALSLVILAPSVSQADTLENNQTRIEELAELHNAKSTIVITKDEGINFVSLTDREIKETFDKLLEDGKEQLDKGNVFKAYKTFYNIDLIKEKYADVLSDESLTNYKTIKLRFERIVKKKLELSKVVKEMENSSYEDALKTYNDLNLGVLEKSYQEEFFRMNELLRTKKVDKTNDEILQETETQIQELKDEDYKKAEEIVKKVKINNPTEKQKEQIKRLMSYPEKMKKNYDKIQAIEKEKEEEESYTESSTGEVAEKTYTYSIEDEDFSEIVKGAYEQLGKSYVFGASDPNYAFDCSGLTHYLYRTYFGINLPRTAEGQSHVGKSVTDMKQGDLLFFNTSGSGIGHVAMYVGNGKMIHASNPTRGVVIDDVDAPWYSNILVNVQRIVE